VTALVSRRKKRRKLMTEEQMIRTEAQNLKRMMHLSDEQQHTRLRQLKLTASTRLDSHQVDEEQQTTG
jgi:hypothetical protein